MAMLWVWYDDNLAKNSPEQLKWRKCYFEPRLLMRKLKHCD